MSILPRKNCRVCGSSSLTQVIDLGEQYLQGSFIKTGKKMPPMDRYPTSLVLCNKTIDKNACGLLQMEYTVPPEILYSVYWYRSGTNTTMRNHLRSIVEETTSIVKRSNACVLDIGCNDGTLLSFYPNNFIKFGIDPSDIADEVKSDVNFIKGFFPSDNLIKKLNGQKVDIVTSVAMFYDLESPIEFTKGIKNLLNKEGIWVLEMAYMPSMLEMNSYDTICHEHLEYYSLSVIEYILDKADMKIINASLNSINGSSLRCYVTHKSNFMYDNENYTQNIKILREKEKTLKLHLDEPYTAFQHRIRSHKNELNSLLKNLKAEGKKIHVYGASTKGNTILQWCEIDNKTIDVAAERNPDKYGAYTIGTNIPIVSELESRAMNPDYYLVLPWHFREEIIEREQHMLNKGVKFIFPLPMIEIVKQ